ncbi:MAG: hypothetical protein ACYTEQ_31365 [Planctomycetota bacterium]|jgi:hypothetical protein
MKTETLTRIVTRLRARVELAWLNAGGDVKRIRQALADATDDWRDNASVLSARRMIRLVPFGGSFLDEFDRLRRIDSDGGDFPAVYGRFDKPGDEEIARVAKRLHWSKRRVELEDVELYLSSGR